MKRIKFSIAELCMVVAVCAAAVNLGMVLAPHWGEICLLASNIAAAVSR
jgi:hypothetical protein